jgi:hypothetical protein
MSEVPPSSPPSSTPSALHYGTSSAPPSRGNGSGWILAVAILQFIGGLVMFGMTVSKTSTSNPEAIAALVFMLLLAGIFFGLWLWGRKAPFPALLTALIVFVSFHLLDAVLDPLSLLRGIIVKVIVIAGLCAALKKAYVAKREKELAGAAP